MRSGFQETQLFSLYTATQKFLAGLAKLGLIPSTITIILRKGISRGLDSVALEGVAVSVEEVWGDDGAGAGVGNRGGALETLRFPGEEGGVGQKERKGKGCRKMSDIIAQELPVEVEVAGLKLRYPSVCAALKFSFCLFASLLMT